MKAVVRHRYGSPHLLHLEEIQKPTARDDELFIPMLATLRGPEPRVERWCGHSRGADCQASARRSRRWTARSSRRGERGVSLERRWTGGLDARVDADPRQRMSP